MTAEEFVKLYTGRRVRITNIRGSTLAGVVGEQGIVVDIDYGGPTDDDLVLVQFNSGYLPVPTSFGYYPTELEVIEQTGVNPLPLPG